MSMTTVAPNVRRTISEKFPSAVHEQVAALFEAATKIKPKAKYEEEAVANPDDSLAQLIACC